MTRLLLDATPLLALAIAAVPYAASFALLRLLRRRAERALEVRP